MKKPGNLTDRSGIIDTRISFHSKTFIVDAQRTAICSSNWDPQAEIWHAEIGVDSEAILAQTLTTRLEKIWPVEASRVIAERQHSIGLE